MARQTLSFEKALERLETIVNEIESGEVPLEKSIEKYAEGIELVRSCRKTLDSAEKKIQLLARKEDGELAPAGELGEEEAGPPGEDVPSP